MANTANRVWLARHGQRMDTDPAWKPQVCHHTEVPLSPLRQRQAEALGRRLATARIDNGKWNLQINGDTDHLTDIEDYSTVPINDAHRAHIADAPDGMNGTHAGVFLHELWQAVGCQ